MAVGGLVNGHTLAECQRSGVTVSQFGNISSNSAGQYNELSGGNLGLRPETSNTVTTGVVFAPRGGALRDLTLSVDYFDIKVNRLIGTVGANLILSQCVVTGDPRLCSFIQRDPANGSLYLGQTGHVSDTRVNIGSKQTRGIDVTAAYRLPLDRLGWAGAGL